MEPSDELKKHAPTVAAHLTGNHRRAPISARPAVPSKPSAEQLGELAGREPKDS